MTTAEAQISKKLTTKKRIQMINHRFESKKHIKNGIKINS